MRNRLCILALAGIAALSLSASAAPAPWYRWQNTVNADMTICSQISPGDGWIMVKGPYEDAQCRKPGKPGDNWK